MTTQTPQTRTLVRALEIAGDAERLAERLDCDTAQLARWVSGEDLTPAAVYLKVLDLVSRGPDPAALRKGK